jgi:hypothetical protein
LSAVHVSTASFVQKFFARVDVRSRGRGAWREREWCAQWTSGACVSIPESKVRVRARWSLSGLVALATLLMPGQALSAFELQVNDRAVAITNVPAGASVVLFTCARTTLNRRMHLQTWSKVLSDDDRNGVIEFAAERGVPLRSVWIAVDLATGEHAIGARPDYPLWRAPLALSRFRKDAEGELAAIEFELPRLILLFVRPGKGAWIVSSDEGGAGDGDGTPNFKLLIRASDAVAVAGKDAPPRHLRNGDFVAAIDPGSLDIWSTEVGK